MTFMELSRLSCERHDLPPATCARLADDGSRVSGLILARAKAMESEVQKAKKNI